MAVDAARVKELREKTGLPMMECKKALTKVDGDVEKALEELRKGGMKAQEKLAGRAANQGKIGNYISEDGKVGALVALCCETDPVAKNENFLALLSEVVEVVSKASPKDRDALLSSKLPGGTTVSDGVTELIHKIRENISVGQFARFEADAVVQYVHFDQKKAAMIALKGGSASSEKVAEVGREIGMHIVFSNLTEETRPLSLTREGLDPKSIEREREILISTAQADPKNAKKPPQILEKIIEGQVNKFIASRVLLEQPYARDPKLSVGDYVKGSGANVTVEAFVYVSTDQD